VVADALSHRSYTTLNSLHLTSSLLKRDTIKMELEVKLGNTDNVLSALEVKPTLRDEIREAQ